MRYKKHEIWNLGYTILNFALPRLKAFRRMKRHGYPDAAAKSMEEWDQMLDKMIWSLEMCQKPNSGYDKFLSKKSKLSKVPKKLPDGSTQYTVIRQGDWDNKGLKAHQKRLEEGLELFGKWWISLWD